MEILEEKLKRVLAWLEQYKAETNCKGVVIGLSGGKDSTVVAMMAKKVWGDNVFAVLMPNGTQSDINDSEKIAQTLGLWCRTVNIGETYKALLKCIETTPIEAPLSMEGYTDTMLNCPPVTDKSKTNIPPRLRMTVLYAIAQSIGYRVIGTSNASERYIGWSTKWGDSASDVNPIGNLTCTEVVEMGKILAKEFGLDEKFVSKKPSDGLTGKSDEENFGFSYEELDKWILFGEGVSKEVADKIEEMHKYSEHKREMPPIFVI